MKNPIARHPFESHSNTFRRDAAQGQRSFFAGAARPEDVRRLAQEAKSKLTRTMETAAVSALKTGPSCGALTCPAQVRARKEESPKPMPVTTASAPAAAASSPGPGEA